MVRLLDPAIPFRMLSILAMTPAIPLMFDETHPNANGYAVWPEHLKVLLKTEVGNKK